MARRKRREGETNCDCAAYPFRHRWMGGRCDGGALVDETFELFAAECRECFFYDSVEHRCEVSDGREPALRCPAVEERIRYEGTKIYGCRRA